MFCTKCGRENRDDANYCAHCGANTRQIPPARVIEATPSIGRFLWIAGIATFFVFLGMVMSVAVCAWALSQDAHQDGSVLDDGRIVVGADGEPIELTQNPEATDVTWAKLKRFLSSDRTDGIRYDEDTFVCADFAESLHNNAEEAGIRAGYVVIHFTGDSTGHACNVFYTTDKGIIYVDDTGTLDGSVNADKTVDLAIGESFCPVSIFPNPGSQGDWECMGTVSDFSVTW